MEFLEALLLLGVCVTAILVFLVFFKYFKFTCPKGNYVLNEMCLGIVPTKIDLNTIIFLVFSTALLTYALLSLLCKMGEPINEKSSIFIYSVLFAPIWEEVFFRGLLLNIILVILIPIYQKLANDKGMELILLFSIFFIVSFIFAALHNNASTQSWLARVICGLYYSIVYYASGRKIIAPIVAHSTYNLFIQMCVFMVSGSTANICRLPFL